VIVTVITMHVMQVIAHEIVGVSRVRHALVAARRAVRMSCAMAGAAVIRRAFRSVHVRRVDRVLVRVIAINMMEMAIVKIISVAVVPDGRVTACGSVGMRVPFMRMTFVSHDPPPSWRMR
jgi:hypothetical protein